MTELMKWKVRTPNKKRFLDALRHRESAEIPFYELEFYPGIVSAILGRKIADRSYLMSAGDSIEFACRVGLDLCHLGVPWWLGREKYTDENGMVRYKPGAMEAGSDLRRIKPPDLDSAKRRIEALLKAREGTALGWTVALPTTAAVIVAAMGFENYYTAVREDPAFVENFLDRIEEQLFPVTEAVLSYQPDAVCLAAFVCFKSGLLMSRELTERFVLGRMERHLRLFHAKSVPVVVHSDGDNAAVMDRWIGMGIAAFHPVEPSEQYTIYEYKKRWGDRIALCGNIDCATVLSRGSPEEVARDTLAHLERLSAGGGYICGSSNDIDDNIPLENLRAMAETVAQYKRGTGNQRGL